MRLSRREFLARTLGTSTVLSIGAVTPAFLRHAAALDADAGESILVVIQLTGGNDGLNTVIPYLDPVYRSKRPQLAIPEADVLKIGDDLGLHSSCRGLADLLEAGHLGIVQGVGYPDPNRSHFESMDIWHTCRRGRETRTTGWLGRYLDAAYPGEVRDAPAVHLGPEQQPLALTAGRVRTPSIQSLERFRLQDGGDQRVRTVVAELSAAARSEAGSLLDFVQTSSSAALTASQRVEAALGDYRATTDYPQNAFAQKLQTVAQLIDAGLATRVYYLELDGFDTHSQQAAVHAALLSQFSDASAAFLGDLNAHGHGDRVLVMAFSEFGRRVEENASEGTDHGAAAPVFIAGNRAKSGLIGPHPSLTELDQGDLKFHTDFRCVYAALLDHWLKWPSAEILGDGFAPIELLTT